MRELAEVRVSVAICVRDGERYLAEAIDSAWNQSLQPCQVLVVDDGSRDNSAKIAKSLGCDVVSQAPRGIGASRNRAFREALGDCVLFLDSDDLLLESAIHNLVGALNTEADALGAVGYRENFISPELVGSMTLTNEEFLKKEKSLLPPGGLWKKEVGQRLRFSEHTEVADVEWVMNFQSAGVILAHTDALVMRRRIHLSNHSLRPETRQDYLSLARRRMREEV
jgi:glycosyltransferase involved in cell wall biosynthesis